MSYLVNEKCFYSRRSYHKQALTSDVTEGRRYNSFIWRQCIAIILTSITTKAYFTNRLSEPALTLPAAIVLNFCLRREYTGIKTFRLEHIFNVDESSLKIWPCITSTLCIKSSNVVHKFLLTKNKKHCSIKITIPTGWNCDFNVGVNVESSLYSCILTGCCVVTWCKQTGWVMKLKHVFSLNSFLWLSESRENRVDLV